MSTNYYIIKNRCDCCGRGDKEHIGKSSSGWSFVFQGTEKIRNFAQWLENVKSADEIVNDEGDRIVLSFLLSLIEEKKEEKRHALYYSINSWLDENYNSFLERDFS